MGRSRGVLTTKIHALVDTEGRPIRLKLTEGQAHYGRSAADMFETLKAGHILLADRAYDSDALRAEMAGRGVWANIRAMPNRVKSFPFSAWVYRQRNAVERFFNKLKHFRAIPHDTTSATTIFSRQSNSLQSASGCELMSRSPRACGDSSRVYHGSSEVNKCLVAAVGFGGAHGDAFELFEFAEEVLDEVSPFVDLCIDLSRQGSAGMLRDHDLGAAFIEVSDNGIAVEGFVGEQSPKLDTVNQRCDSDAVKTVTRQ
ncbi:transposase [Labrenzia sp. MBR-25]